LDGVRTRNGAPLHPQCAGILTARRLPLAWAISHFLGNW